MYDFQNRFSVRNALAGLTDYDLGEGRSFEDFCDLVWNRSHRGGQLGDPFTILDAEVDELLAEYADIDDHIPAAPI